MGGGVSHKQLRQGSRWPGEVSVWRPLRVPSAGCLPPASPQQSPEGQDRGTFSPGPRAGGTAHKLPSLPARSPRVGQSGGGYMSPDADLCHPDPDQGPPLQPAWLCPHTCGWARAGQRPLLRSRWSHVAAVGIPCPRHSNRPSPPSHRRPGSQMLPPGPGVGLTATEGRRAGKSRGARGATSLWGPPTAGPGSPEPGPGTVAPGLPRGGC